MGESPQRETSRTTSGWKITEDISAKLLHLSWNGDPPWQWRRRIANLSMSIAAIGWVTLVFETIKAFQQIAPQRGDDGLLAVMSGMGFVFLYLTSSALGNVLGYWHELKWDESANAFTARRYGWLFWGNQTQVIKFNQVNTLSMRIGPEGKQPISLQLYLSYDQPLSHQIDLTRLAVHTREAGQKLIFAIARVMKASSFRIEENTPQSLAIQLWMNTPKEELGDDNEEDELPNEYLPIPELGKSSHVSTAKRPKAEDTVRCKTPVDISMVQQSLTISKIETWNPGVLVRIVRPSAPWFVYVFVIGISLIPAGLLGKSVVFNLLNRMVSLEEHDRLYVIVFSLLLTAGFTGFLTWNNFKIREVFLDWTKNRLTLRYGNMLRHWSFAAIQEIVLSEKVKYESFEEDDEPNWTPQKSGFGSRLHAVLPDEDLLLLETEKWEKEEKSAREILAPIGRELASAIHVRYSRSASRLRDQPEITSVFRMTRIQQSYFIALVLIAISFLSVAGIRIYRVKQAVVQLKSLGVDAEFYGRFDHNKTIVCQNYVNVKITDRALIDDHRDEISKLLLQLPKVALNIQGSNLRDADLEPFRGVRFCMLRITNTQIGDDGLAYLCANQDLVFIDATQTKITDASVPVFKQLSRLRFLFFRETGISFEGSRLLHGTETLEFVEP